MADTIDHDQFQPENMEAAAAAFYTVAIYLADRAYGGPEEGGWWYDCGQRIDSPDEHGERNVPKLFPGDEQGRKEAGEFCRQVQARLDEGANRLGNRDLSSVCCEGRYVAQVCENYPAPHYPAERPHYE